jgi:hypothetical protein
VQPQPVKQEPVTKQEPKPEPPQVEAAPIVSEPASVTQPLAALTLLETPVEQPQQLGLLDTDTEPSKEDSLQLELLPEPVRQSG